MERDRRARKRSVVVPHVVAHGFLGFGDEIIGQAVGTREREVRLDHRDPGARAQTPAELRADLRDGEHGLAVLFREARVRATCGCAVVGGFEECLEHLEVAGCEGEGIATVTHHGEVVTTDDQREHRKRSINLSEFGDRVAQRLLCEVVERP